MRTLEARWNLHVALVGSTQEDTWRNIFGINDEITKILAAFLLSMSETLLQVFGVKLEFKDGDAQGFCEVSDYPHLGTSISIIIFFFPSL